jgi:hypothetical protein
MLLTILVSSAIVFALTALIMVGAGRERAERPSMSLGLRVPTEPPRFFAADAASAAAASRVPVEVLLSHIERHVRLEQAAAETFVARPTTESLHSRTASPLVN